MVIWDITKWKHSPMSFGMEDKDEFIKQLSVGNRIIMESGVRGKERISFYGRYFKEQDIFYIWLTNDERKKLLNSLEISSSLQKSMNDEKRPKL